MRTFNVWLDDLLRVFAVCALPSQIKNGARWTGNKARDAWRYLCQLARYVSGAAKVALMLAIIWLAARQIRRAGTAEARAELATFAAGVALMLALFVAAQRRNHGEPPPDLSGLGLGGA